MELYMSKDTDDAGKIATLLQRLNKFRLPRLLELKERVNRGEAPTESDIEFLGLTLEDAHSAVPLIDRHRELQPLAAKLTALYQEITAKALENEAKNQGR
jgi:hypothetical protein